MRQHGAGGPVANITEPCINILIHQCLQPCGLAPSLLMRTRGLEIRRLDTRQSQLSLKLMNFFPGGA